MNCNISTYRSGEGAIQFYRTLDMSGPENFLVLYSVYIHRIVRIRRFAIMLYMIHLYLTLTLTLLKPTRR